MNIIAKNSFTNFLKNWGDSLPIPKAILMVSAHWETFGTKVSKMERPKTIYDFSGFPDELYQINYPAPGSPEVAELVKNQLSPNAESDEPWGLDHGTWSILHHLYPKADVPVLQMSLNRNLKLRDHWRLATQLRQLRKMGVLIIGSGNITHNLQQIVWQEQAPAIAWAAEFDELIKEALVNRDFETLWGERPEQQTLWQMAHPRLDHYLPLLYTIGASDFENENIQFPFAGFQNGSLSMRAVSIQK